MLSSDVSTDIVDGHSVTFPTASPHTITATLGAATTSIVIQVTPSPSKAGAAVLPQTGGDASALPFVVGGAVALLLAGAVLLSARRRTRR